MESQPGGKPRDWEVLRRWDPERIGPYVVLGRLGSGSMGQVYLGRSAAGRHADLAVAAVSHFRSFAAATGPAAPAVEVVPVPVPVPDRGPVVDLVPGRRPDPRPDHCLHLGHRPHPDRVAAGARQSSA